MARRRSKLRRFGKTGRSSTSSVGGSGRTANAGFFDPTTGLVYKPGRSRASQGVEGSSVRVTNPRASARSRARRTASVGMGTGSQRIDG